ncbi:MAG: hypothetical protein OHK0046_33940 [Anaerolineae bacterium]
MRKNYVMVTVLVMMSLFIGLHIITLNVIAQEGVVTDDEVNSIAKQLYCPVCENIPLDTCETAACMDWRYEIRLQLEDGLTEEHIIDDFVRRFGDRVVGTPQDPTLRALSLVTPVLFAVIGMGAVAMIAWRWRKRPSAHILDQAAGQVALKHDWYAQLERDVKGK